jgi:hypothetical protein
MTVHLAHQPQDESPPENSNAAAAATVDYEGLARLGYTKGLCEALVESNQHLVAKRFWILDHSGSMAATDATRLVAIGSSSADAGQIQQQYQFESCTR